MMFGRKATWLILALTFFTMLIVSCEKIDSFEEVDVNVIITGEDRFSLVDSSEWIYKYQEWLDNVSPLFGKEAVQHRALQLARIQWEPKYYNIPSLSGFYYANTTYVGVPYSLAIKTDSYIGTQVSPYTFMTAVDNPYSLLYTENLREAPYHGFDCAPYYGSSCSNSVMYALGIEPPYYTYMIPSILGMLRPRGQTPQDIEPCDIRWIQVINATLWV